MKHALRTLLIVSLACSLAGCGVVAKLAGPNPLLSGPAQVKVARGRYDFELAYNIAASAYMAVEPNLSDGAKARAKVIGADLYKALLASRTAQAAGDATSLGERLKTMNALFVQFYAVFAPGSAPPLAIDVAVSPQTN